MNTAIPVMAFPAPKSGNIISQTAKAPNFTHIDVALQFTETRYQGEYWLTPEGSVIAPLPEHVKGRFGDNLIAMVLDLYHSCSVTQNHDAFHQEREDILEMGIAHSHALLVDDTGARH